MSLPAIMYGTAWKKERTASLVEQAVESGFRAIDTANQLIHYDEASVGKALARLAPKGYTRESLFLQTKFTPVGGQDHRTPYDARADLTTQVNQSFQSSLEHLGTDYLDSYLLHGPYSRNGITDDDLEVWRAMESIYQSGGTRAIGISNVNAGQLEELCRLSTVKPMHVQNRCYAIRGWDRDVREICDREKIKYQAFSLLTANPSALADSRLQSMARARNVTVQQIVFSFAISMGMLPLTGTCNPEHMRQDLDSISIELSESECDTLETVS